MEYLLKRLNRPLDAFAAQMATGQRRVTKTSVVGLQFGFWLVGLLSRVSLRIILICIVTAAVTNCASKPKGFILPVALSETLRGGELKGLESNTNGDLGIPNDNDLTSKVCVSKPQFNMYGQYVTTIVKCW